MKLQNINSNKCAYFSKSFDYIKVDNFITISKRVENCEYIIYKVKKQLK